MNCNINLQPATGDERCMKITAVVYMELILYLHGVRFVHEEYLW